MQKSLSFDRSHLCKKLKFSFFELLLHGSKKENFILKSNHIVWPINEREFCINNMESEKRSIQYSLEMGLIFFYFEDYSKNTRWMILFCLVTCYHTPTLHKNAEKPTVMWFFTRSFLKAQWPINATLPLSSFQAWCLYEQDSSDNRFINTLKFQACIFLRRNSKGLEKG